MFVCVHGLEYVSDTGSLFICPGTRQKDWGNLPSASASSTKPGCSPLACSILMSQPVGGRTGTTEGLGVGEAVCSVSGC